MNSIVEARLKDYLKNQLKYRVTEVGTIIGHMTTLARMSGHELDERFAEAGLGAGPEARVAAGILSLALGMGAETPESTIRQEIRNWLRTNPPRAATL